VPARPDSFTAREAAVALGVSERTVRRAIHRGDLPAVRHGRGFAIAPETLDRYRRQRAGRGTPRLTLLPPAPAPAIVPFPAGSRAWAPSLPTPLTGFVGREREVDALCALLRREDVRLVTLTGPGGVGKTRLALRVASTLQSAFPDGAAFVPLAPVRAAELVPATIALALGVREDEDRPPWERLRRALRDRHALLVLDNMEQVVAAGPPLADLLAACPRLTVLATSRGPLHLSGEWVVPVPPLTLPTRRAVEESRSRAGSQALLDSPTARLLDSSEAVRLFVDRAAAAAAGFALTAENAADVAAICVRTDGLPLAIELAAARIAVLSPAHLLARLDPRLPLLSGGPRDQPDRLQTMRDAIAWSYGLLSPEEQALFRRLSVFVGGCTLDAAEWVLGVGSWVLDDETDAGHPAYGPFPNTQHPTPNTLAALIDQSLVQRAAGPADEPRFTLLETIREFGLERLTASGEEPAVRDAHAAWCLAFAERAEPELTGPDQERWVRKLEAELGNIRAAHDWLAARGDVASSLRLAGAIGWFWSSAPYFDEARARFDAILALPGAADHPAALAKVLASAGDVADWQGDQPRARAFYERALVIYRALGDHERTAGMLRGLGSSAIDRGEIELAISLLEESLALAQEAGAAWEVAAATNLLGTAVTIRGDLSGALERHAAAAAGWRALGDTGHVVTALTSLAWVALLAREEPRAATAYREALELAAAGGDSWYVAWCVIGAGGLAAARGDLPLAAELLACGSAGRERLGILLRPATQDALDEIVAAVRRRLGNAAFAAAWERGRALPLETAAAQAMDVFVAALPPVPPPYGLTRRERDVLRLLAAGQSDKEIADALFVSPRTASAHVSAILGKLGVDSRAAAIALAFRQELV
jgi:excisionase family DNA binding protein